MDHQETNGQGILGGVLLQDKLYKIKTYDFKRPDKFSKEQIRIISIMHEVFARHGSIALSAYSRKEAKLHVASVDQLTYEEFIRSIPNPSIMGVVGMDPLPGAAVLQMDPRLFSALEDRLMGGAGKPASLDRDITEIEMQLARRLLSLMLSPLEESWRQIVEIEPDVKSIEANPQLCQIVHPTEMIVLVSIEVTIGDQQNEFINLAMPYVILEPIVSRLTAKYYYRSEERFGKRQPSVRIETRDLTTDMTIVAEGPELSLAALAGLRAGDTLSCPGLDRKEAWLQTGDQDVVKFSFDGDPAAKSVSFSVTGGSVWLSEPASNASDGLSESLTNFTNELRGAMDQLKNGFKELVDRQDEMADQLFLSGADSRSEATRYGRSKPFDFVAVDDIEVLYGFIRREHPQLSALVLSYLDPKAASRLISLFDGAEQIDLARRIAALDRTQPEVLADVEEALRLKLNLFDKGGTLRTGGLESITSILNLTSRSVERTIIEGLEQSNADLAEEIKKRMFVFEDIVLLDRKVIAKLLGKARLSDFAIAMRGVEQKVADHILGACDETMKRDILSQREEMGPVRLTDVDAAQMRIVGVIRKMEQEGEIVIARPDELIL